MKKPENFTVNPNVIYVLPPEPIDENETINLSQQILPRSPDIRIESGKLVRFNGENEFSLKIGGTTYEVNTHFSKKGKQSVLEQFKELILSENLI
ncbi:transposon-encoded TnpW family protein [Lachnospiraceae bacterium 47-T17]